MKRRRREQIRGLERRVGELEALLDEALARLVARESLIRDQASLVAELPGIAVWTDGLIAEIRELRDRAEVAERSLDNAVAMLCAGTPTD